MSEATDPLATGSNVLFWIVATLAGAVASLWKISEGKNAKAIEELRTAVNRCEEDREHLRSEMVEARVSLARISERLDICEGK